jgi:hypothetical protein
MSGSIVLWLANLIVPALAGLGGVALGGWITTRTQRIERLHNRIREQLKHFYSPLLGMRAQILAKSEVRSKVSGAADAAWQNLIGNTYEDTEVVRKVEQERFPDFEKIVEYNNRQLIEELLPLYRQMVEHFGKNMWLAEPSTLKHFGALVEFLEVWNRWLNGTLPREVVRLLGHSEDKLQPLYQDLARQSECLSQKLKG